METLLNSLLQSTTETEVLEFKVAKTQYDKDKLGKYFSALSNEANLKGKSSAWILLGVNNQKQVVGTNISDKQLNEYKSEISNHTSPTLCFIDAYRLIVEGGTVIMLQIPPAPQGMPVAWKSIYYGRDGESLGGLNIDELERIRSQSKNVDWSAQIIKNANIHDLSSEAILMAREQYREKNPKLKDDIDQWDDSTFLNKARITIDGKITNTAIVLLGKPESEHLLSPALARITWVLKDRDGFDKDYEHFSCPFLLQVQNVYAKIRNIKYRYMQEGTLFPDEVNQFEPYTIREALNNCIAHQDYTMGGKINLVEREDGVLIFSNSGDFIPKSIEKVIEADAPETRYRNPFLASAMVNLNMIDTIGSGIKRLFLIQKDKFFPLPDYNLSDRKVTVAIIGKVIDVNYARKLAQMKGLSLAEIMLLDKVQKNKELTKSEIQFLRNSGLIEGRKPNIHISSMVASETGQKADYIKQRGIEDDYCKKIILDYLIQFKEGKSRDFEKILLSKLADRLSFQQKKNKIKNILQSLKNEGKIVPYGKLWKLSENV